MSDVPSSFAAEFHRLILERCRELPPLTPRGRPTDIAMPAAGFNPERPVGNPVTADPRRRMRLHLDRPFSRPFIGVRHSKPNMMNMYQESARVFHLMQNLRAMNDKGRFHFEQSRRKGKSGVVPPLPKGVTLTIEAQGQEFTNLLLTDLPWTNDPDLDNIHKIDSDFPDVYFTLSDRANLADTRADTFNQVQITGPIHDVEQVRQRFLKIVPYMLCLPILSYCAIPENEVAQRLEEMQHSDGPLSPFDRIQFFTSERLDQGFCVETHIGPAFESLGIKCNLYIIIKGAMRDYSMIIDAVTMLRDVLYPIPMAQPSFLTGIDFPQTMAPWLQDSQIASKIAAKTDATILSPDFSYIRGINVVLTFFIAGEALNVLTAVMELHRAVPIRLTFHCEHSDIKNGPFLTAPYRILDYVDADNCFLIELRPSGYEVSESQKRHCISITSAHENINYVYAAYGWIFDLDEIPMHTETLSTMKLFTQNTLNRLKQHNVVDEPDGIRNQILSASRTLVFLKTLPHPQASTYKGFDYESLPRILYRGIGDPSPMPMPMPMPSTVGMDQNLDEPTTPLMFFRKSMRMPMPNANVNSNPDAANWRRMVPRRPVFEPNRYGTAYRPRRPPLPQFRRQSMSDFKGDLNSFAPHQEPSKQQGPYLPRRPLSSTGSNFHQGGRVFYRSSLNSNSSNPPNRRFSHH